ncbi:integrase, catalytic region, zinc finger, CCHC-type containing protein [Tanacetum coccineum]|uniref:Integrase, catalytic region, zinc finger, CCHC-type containing protein n=1 Tax=Tanacetum coccineum TaxID=301880 RepID=A0ABQ4XI58_9ASTR
MENLESEKVSLEFQVQSLIKERENVETEYQKLFDSIKRTRTQTQGEINELIENINQKTYAYAYVCAQNQDLLITISELKAKLKNVENGLRAISSVRIPSHRDSSFKNSVLSNTKNSSDKVEVSDRKSLFTTLRIVKSQFEDTTPVVSKNSSLSNYMKNKIQTSRMWQKWYELQPNIGWSPVKMPPNIVNSGCSKHMTGDRSLLNNFVKKFIGTVLFRNDHFLTITDYGDYVQGNITVCHVYYVKGLGHNLFSVGQFYNGDLEVAFRSRSCYMRNLEGDDLLTRDHESNLYTISISNMAASSSVCLMSKATSTKSWLWHRRLSHLNFGTINDLTKHDLVDGLLKFKYGKDHLCSACEWGKSKKASHPPKLVPSNHSKLELLHMDLCRPMRVASINGKRKPNVEYFHMFGSLYYPTKERDDLGKMKPKADIGIFIGYSETSRGFRIYNRHTKKIMETIHVKFDELIAMASEYESLEPNFQRMINDDSSAESINIPSKEDLDNLFRPMYEEYFEKRSSDTFINSAA